MRCGACHRDDVTRSEAIDRLPNTYRQIVTFLDQGVQEEEIARELDLELESVGPLITVAQAKLERLLVAPSHP